tara:strand:- start:8528 stop:9979 length:1452 start_codon:yes stop_codon:yes gene_type:complete
MRGGSTAGSRKDQSYFSGFALKYERFEGTDRKGGPAAGSWRQERLVLAAVDKFFNAEEDIIMRLAFYFAICAVTFLATGAVAKELSRAEPEAVGLSAEHLSQIDSVFEEKIGAGEFPGAVFMVARHGKIVHSSALGARTEGGEAMTEDTIFRIYSMTKPITSVVALSLIEEGKLDLGAPLHQYLPEFKEMKVATGRSADGTIESEPVARPIRVIDLMRHTAGLTYGFFGTGVAREALKEKNPGNGQYSNRELAEIIGTLPLEYHPGTTWEYSRATDILGAVIEVVDGRPLSEAMKARVFDPLDMKNTGFYVEDAANYPRIAEPNADDRMIGNIAVFDPRKSRVFETGGGGLVSTSRDYARFMQMLLNRGELDGVRILSPFTVDYMLTDQLGSIGPGKYYLPGQGYGFGLGVAVRKEVGASPLMGSVGDFFWGGAAGTYMAGDPQEDMFLIYMVQSPKNGTKLRATIRNMTYGAITELNRKSAP